MNIWYGMEGSDCEDTKIVDHKITFFIFTIFIAVLDLSKLKCIQNVDHQYVL